MNKFDWQTNWKEFCCSIANDIDSGLDDEAISKKYGDKEVLWSGTIIKNEIDQEYSPGLSIDMPEVTYSLNNGKYILFNYLFLKVDKRSLASWKNSESEEIVNFRTKLISSNGPFSGIKFYMWDDDDKVIMGIGTRESYREK